LPTDIETSDIVLRPLERADLDCLTPMFQDADVLRFTRLPAPMPETFLDDWFAKCSAGRQEGTIEVFAICQADEVVGVAMAPRIDAEARTAELGYMLTPSARGRGVAQEALRKLTAWGFNVLGAERLELKITTDNPASSRVAARCGYQREGVRRSMYLKANRRQDTEIWSRLPGDPPIEAPASPEG
jgi:RimJ/RimL family protein N-acetyltransferase